MRTRTFVVAAVAGSLLFAPSGRCITPTSSNEPGGKSAQQLAMQIVDSTTGIVLVPASANFDIDSFGISVPSDLRSVGSFTNGFTSAGTLLPTNQNTNGDAAYAGGIGIADGVCLCTGLVTDKEDAFFPDPNPEGAGLEGPNNGNGGNGTNAGEMNTIIGSPRDQDFEQFTGLIGNLSGDAAVLQFEVTISAPSFIRLSFIFGSDEVPAWLNQPFNDSFAAIIDSENIADTVVAGVSTPFDLQEIEGCSKIFVQADVAPSPAALPASAHAQAGQPLYDVELGGFTKLLSRETKCVLAPGTYNTHPNLK